MKKMRAWLYSAQIAEEYMCISGDGESCSQCGGGPLRMLGVPTVRGNKENQVKIRVSVEREELDRLMKDMDNVNKLANEAYDKIRKFGKIKIEC